MIELEYFDEFDVCNKYCDFEYVFKYELLS